MPKPTRFRLGFFATSLVCVGLDQATKYWALHFLCDSPIIVIPNVLFLRLATNPGAAFSMFSHYPSVLTVVACIVAVVVFVWLMRIPRWDWPTALALSLILGGAAGNLVDRFRFGEVVDFVEVHFEFLNWSWPTFNLADSAICVGMGLLLFATVFPRKSPEEQPQPVGDQAM
ncbi:MAG: signal peptidase II [Candidatus Sumerlaeota bacterium]|nr:signal peptidase II [Candidatus Sumerlaeota bacterium]